MLKKKNNYYFNILFSILLILNLDVILVLQLKCICLNVIECAYIFLF